ECPGQSQRGSCACPLCSDSNQVTASQQSAASCQQRSLGGLLPSRGRPACAGEMPADDSSFLRDGALANFLNRRRLHAHYDLGLIGLLDQQFYQRNPATNQFEFVIVKRPALSILSILYLRGHGALLSFAGRARASFPFTQR